VRKRRWVTADSRCPRSEVKKKENTKKKKEHKNRGKTGKETYHPTPQVCSTTLI